MRIGPLTNPKFILPVIIFLMTLLLVFGLFASNNATINFKASALQPPFVNSISLKHESIHIPVYGRAFIEPQFSMQLRSQVAGQVIKVSPSFADGADFKQGDTLLEIDDRQLRLAYSQAKAALEQAKVNELELEARFKASKNMTKKSSPFAQGKPQLEAAKANTAA